MGTDRVPGWPLLCVAVLALGCSQGVPPSATTAAPGDARPAKAAAVDPAAMPAPSAPLLATMIARGSCVQLAEVVAMEDVDERPGDGNYDRCFTLKIVQSSGTAQRVLRVPIAYGGMRSGPAPPLPTHLRSDSLRLGGKYWFLLGSDFDVRKYANSVVAWWPDGKAPREITQLVRQDAFHWRPIYHLASGLTYGYQILSPTRWQLIVKRDGVSAWDLEIGGAFASDRSDVNDIRVLGAAYQMDPIDAPEAEHRTFLIYPITRMTLPDDNRFEVPPGEYRVRFGRELRSGKLLAEWVLPLKFPDDPLALRQYNQHDGKLILAARLEAFPSGGLAVGSDREFWLRKTLKRYAADGTVTSVRVFRHGSVKDASGNHSYNGWVPIEPKHAGDHASPGSEAGSGSQ